MFRKLHYYDDFYLDDGFWNSIAGKGRMRKKGLTKAIGEMPLYGSWRFCDRDSFLQNYEWCKLHGIVSSFLPDIVYKARVLEGVYVHWESNVGLCEDDARCKVVEEQGNPFDRLAKGVICHKDSDGNDYARFFLNETDAECDGYVIEVATLFNFDVSRECVGGKTVYSFKCAKQ
jgi:hypothetical protein